MMREGPPSPPKNQNVSPVRAPVDLPAQLQAAEASRLDPRMCRTAGSLTDSPRPPELKSNFLCRPCSTMPGGQPVPPSRRACTCQCTTCLLVVHRVPSSLGNRIISTEGGAAMDRAMRAGRRQDGRRAGAMNGAATRAHIMHRHLVHMLARKLLSQAVR